MKKIVILAIAALILSATPALLGCRQPERDEEFVKDEKVINKETREVIPGEVVPQQGEESQPQGE
jgi:uncharacterized protein YxeA